MIEALIYHTISATEILWTIVCSIGVYYSQKLFRRSLSSVQSLRRRKINSIREYSAQLTVFTYFIILFVQVAFVVAGVVSMLIPPFDSKRPITPLSVAITVTFILVSVILSLGSFIIEARRRRLIDLIEEMESGF